ncbi:hypothetical protein [Mangrovicoccus algicola]|uniref:Uncharacterized protein n=1 Tax=Mangrovicoccus algicola TaxID=2771008 RepID=A0A8J6YWS9_9RHOB|nr:hypothetical protein [Mangrovicoccus algicola]MBE3637478.1 hypothetical protein [Mangrovicoccus algicola]
MERQEQEAGERRVRAILVEPLIRRGLKRPSDSKVAVFEEGLREMCQKLAYMSELNLAGLAEEISARPGGRNQDQFWQINRILNRAAEIEPPSDSASPLLRAVFSNELGRSALRDGWAPELRKIVRDERRWPMEFAVMKAREAGAQNQRRMEVLARRVAQGLSIDPDDAVFLRRRQEVQARCEALAGEGQA